MAVLGKSTKAKLGMKAGRALVTNPGLASLGAQAAAPVGKVSFKVAKPLIKRRARRQAERMGDAARRIGEALATYGPQAAYELGLAEPPKPKRSAPRVALGMVIGAGAVYFLEPGTGREHRRQVAQLVS